jgi:hypothetical protein
MMPARLDNRDLSGSILCGNLGDDSVRRRWRMRWRGVSGTRV